ncbi:MAG: RluA family pseudouridine synthase [Thermoguttaceae bacterium]|jgi:23S rRNA pseudouridine1911/1915/1917 synthase
MTDSAFHNYHVTDEQAGLALVAALRQFRPEESWSIARRWIQNRHVQVNGNLCVDEGRRLQPHDVVKLWQEPRQPPPQAEDVKIVYRDAHLVVVEKPAGVTTGRHSEEQSWPSRRKQVQPTLDEIVARILARQGRKGDRSNLPERPFGCSAQIGPVPFSPGRRRGRPARSPRVRLVHRLDRDTSGVMVLALGAEAERQLVQMFRKHAIHRAYLAIVQGRVEEQTIESRLVRDRGDRRRGSTKLPEVGKRAVTHVRPVENLGDYTLLECRLETGRTHQIRIHLAEAGHPVCGEKVYNKPLFGKPLVDQSGAQRQALHAAELGFQHPVTGEPLRFQMRLPADMQRLLEELRRKAEEGRAEGSGQ